MLRYMCYIDMKISTPMKVKKPAGAFYFNVVKCNPIKALLYI